jgi:hypothetical protein
VSYQRIALRLCFTFHFRIGENMPAGCRTIARFAACHRHTSPSWILCSPFRTSDERRSFSRAQRKCFLHELGNEQSSHLTFARPIIDSAIAIEGLVASSVLMLCARAIGVQDGGERCLYAFATAMELIALSLGVHAQLSNDL